MKIISPYRFLLLATGFALCLLTPPPAVAHGTCTFSFETLADGCTTGAEHAHGNPPTGTGTLSEPEPLALDTWTTGRTILHHNRLTHRFAYFYIVTLPAGRGEVRAEVEGDVWGAGWLNYYAIPGSPFFTTWPPARTPILGYRNYVSLFAWGPSLPTHEAGVGVPQSWPADAQLILGILAPPDATSPVPFRFRVWLELDTPAPEPPSSDPPPGNSDSPLEWSFGRLANLVLFGIRPDIARVFLYCEDGSLKGNALPLSGEKPVCWVGFSCREMPKWDPEDGVRDFGDDESVMWDIAIEEGTVYDYFPDGPVGEVNGIPMYHSFRDAPKTGYTANSPQTGAGTRENVGVGWEEGTEATRKMCEVKINENGYDDLVHLKAFNRWPDRYESIANGALP